MSTSNTTLITDIDSRGVAWVTMNRPEKHNAFDDTVIAELSSTFSYLSKDRAIRVLVLAAQGKNFSAGADLEWMRRMATYNYDENLRDAQALAAMLSTLDRLPFPTIARVQGASFGGAVGLISCCDIAVGTTRSSFSLSEVKIGLIPATISPYVIAAIGSRASRRYFQTAEQFNAAKALHLGLLSSVVDEDELDEQVESFIDSLLKNSPQAVRQAKKLIADVAGKSVTTKLVDYTSETIASIRISNEGQEGLTAFLEKRDPKWLNNSEG